MISLVCVTAVFAGEPAATTPRLPLSNLPFGVSSFVPVPVDNPLTVEKIELGRRLFFEPGLSRDGSISCATCHQPDKSFTDGRTHSVGVGGQTGRRNAPTLLNCAYGQSMFWDGRVATLEEQALLPLTNATELANSLEAVIDRLNTDPAYLTGFQHAFESEQVTPAHLAQALASFQRILVVANSPYDRHLVLKDEKSLGDAARRGFELFRGKARCALCHEPPLFTDHQFHNTGVSWGREPLDPGRFEVTGRDADKGKFKTPTLRQLHDTAPYMHDGRLPTLEEVIAFYDRGAQPNPNLDPVIQPLKLSAQEKADLLGFLRSLSAPVADLLGAKQSVGTPDKLLNRPKNGSLNRN